MRARALAAPGHRHVRVLPMVTAVLSLDEGERILDRARAEGSMKVLVRVT